MKIETAKSCPKSSGRELLIKHLDSRKLTFRQRCIAKCFECMGGYVDGRVDCRITDCPLYPVMPYRESSAIVKS